MATLQQTCVRSCPFSSRPARVGRLVRFSKHLSCKTTNLRPASATHLPESWCAPSTAAAVAPVFHRLALCRSSSDIAEPSAPVVVVEGDVVTFHMTCRDEQGKVLESTKDSTIDNEPMCFEIGAGEIVANPLFQAFDGALRGLGVGESIELQISGGDWKKELLFVVPRDHLEVERLEGRYKNHGGLAEGLTVELANRSMATVVEVTPEHVKLDTNNMMAGKTLLFELEVLKIESNSA
eukprot:GHUV01004860.1.p1 GENE.GHUV01004860.1~~GHUV01004860.1.p1  ORF type:complete len:237 (+),score=50.87 GHUV01004860.1:272-982(+)